MTDQQLHSKAEKLASELNDNYIFVDINGKAVIIPSAADAIFRELRLVRDESAKFTTADEIKQQDSPAYTDALGHPLTRPR
jgi:hypothetical protein